MVVSYVRRRIKNYHAEQTKIREEKMAKTRAHILTAEEEKRKKFEQKWRELEQRKKRKQREEKSQIKIAKAHAQFNLFIVMVATKQPSFETIVQELEKQGQGTLQKSMPIHYFFTSVEKLINQDLDKSSKESIKFVLDPQGEGHVYIEEFLWVLKSQYRKQTKKKTSGLSRKENSQRRLLQ